MANVDGHLTTDISRLLAGWSGLSGFYGGLKMSCPYTDDELEYFDGVCNPMGDACRDCSNFDCEHNATEDFQND